MYRVQWFLSSHFVSGERRKASGCSHAICQGIDTSKFLPMVDDGRYQHGALYTVRDGTVSEDAVALWANLIGWLWAGLSRRPLSRTAGLRLVLRV